MQKLTAPTTDVHGPQRAGNDTLWFHHGVAYTDVREIAQKFRDRGYTVETVAFIPPAHAAAVANAQAEPVHVGARLRDAAVDPRPGDASVPTNAGQPGPLGNPHGPHVVAPQALTREAQAKARGEQLPDPEVTQWR